MRVLIAPDSFGDTLTAVEAANAIGEGWSAGRPDDEITLAPQSDGGPGFVDVLAARFGRTVTERVVGPLGAAITAQWLLDDREPERLVAYIECAQACGLHQLGGGPTPRTAQSADTYGVGLLVDAALQAGVREVVVGLGGSATTDGGHGLIDALGGSARAAERFADVALIAASDVENPLLGPLGAASVFGPQKGADPETVGRLEERLTQWSRVLASIAGRDVSGEPGAGAAGGLGAALLALGARRVSGATVVGEATDQATAIARTDLVLTGEGKFDSQTLRGKVVSALNAAATEVGAPTVVFAGQVALTPDEIAEAGIAGAHSIVDQAGSVELAMSDARNQLTALAARAAASWLPSG
ncbi:MULTISPECIES: glycerate kinase family protein [Gordonia]|uniref:glycerate kinase family protein n=1 Tax=Gordonia TaxID=2053 RepID=UPI002042F4B3|nr:MULTISPECIES: glycerate kinase [Gordonia]MCM3895507.1 glycerate kinase [Gordonia sputi]